VGGVSYGWIPIIVGPEEEGWGRRMTDGGGGTAPPAGQGWMMAGSVTGGGDEYPMGLVRAGEQLVGGRRGGEVGVGRGGGGGGGVGGSPGKKKSRRIRKGGGVGGGGWWAAVSGRGRWCQGSLYREPTGFRKGKTGPVYGGTGRFTELCKIHARF
jgi:hypothetical protein